MLSGKNIAMFLQANFLVESGLMLKIMPLFFDDTSNQNIDHPIVEESNELADDDSDKDILNEYVDPDEWQQAILESKDHFWKLLKEDVEKIMNLLDGMEKNYKDTLKRLAGSDEFRLLKRLVNNVNITWRNLLVHLIFGLITCIISKS